MLVAATAQAAPPRARGELVFADGRTLREPRVLDHRTSGAWQVTWERDRGVAHTFTGSYVEAPGATADASLAERAAREFLAAHLDLIAPGTAAADFTVVANRLDGEVRSVGFEQRWHGLRVVGAQVGFTIAHDHLFAVLARAEPAISPAPSRLITGRAPRGERVVLITPERTRVVELVRRGEWELYLDDTGEVARQSMRRDATGTLEYNAGLRYASGSRGAFAASTAAIEVDGTPTTTTATGTFTWPGSASASVVPSCTGNEVMVVNQAGAAATTSLTVPAGGAAIWNVANSELDDAQVSTYVYGTRRRRARAADRSRGRDVARSRSCSTSTNRTRATRSRPATPSTSRARPRTARTPGASPTSCFTSSATRCTSTRSSPGSARPTSHSRRASRTSTRRTSPRIRGSGADSTSTNAALRDIDPAGVERVYPDDVDFDAHVTGEIVSGALWDLRKALIAQLGHDPGVALTEQLFLGVMRRASDICRPRTPRR